MDANENLWRKVNRWTRAGNQGKEILCPECAAETHVRHFAWSVLKCGNCKEYIEKYKWRYI